MKWTLPTIPQLAKYVIYCAIADLVFFLFSGYSGFSSNVSIVVIFSWLSLGLLFISLTMVVNGFLIRRELLVYFLALYIRLFALAFQLIAMGIGVQHSSFFTGLLTYTTIGVIVVFELIVYGFLLVQLDDLNAEPDIPTDIEGAGVLTKQLSSVNSWTTSVFQFLLVFVPGYGPLLEMGIGKKE